MSCHHQRAQLSHEWGRNSWSIENHLWNRSKIEVQCYLRVFFDLKDLVVVNAHIIYKTKLNARMRLFHFKVIFAKLLINRFSSRKQKFTSEEPQLALELPQTLKEAPHIILFTDNHRRRMYCFSNGDKDTKSFTYCKSYNVPLCVQKDRNCFKLYHT